MSPTEARSGPSPDLNDKQRGRRGVSSAAGAIEQGPRPAERVRRWPALDTSDPAPLHAPTTRASLLDAEDVAMLLGVSKGWIYAEVRAGRIPYVRLGRYVRFRRESIEDWLSEIERGTMCSNSKAPGRGWHRPRHGTGGAISHAEPP
jgi:excisionase family DNA binding protein